MKLLSELIMEQVEEYEDKFRPLTLDEATELMEELNDKIDSEKGDPNSTPHQRKKAKKFIMKQYIDQFDRLVDKARRTHDEVVPPTINTPVSSLEEGDLLQVSFSTGAQTVAMVIGIEPEWVVLQYLLPSAQAVIDNTTHYHPIYGTGTFINLKYLGNEHHFEVHKIQPHSADPTATVKLVDPTDAQFIDYGGLYGSTQI